MSETPEWINECLQQSQLQEEPKTVADLYKVFQGMTGCLFMKILDTRKEIDVLKEENKNLRKELEGLKQQRRRRVVRHRRVRRKSKSSTSSKSSSR